MENKFFAVYACDYTSDGKRCGPETKARLKKLVEVLKDNNTTANYVLLGVGRVQIGLTTSFSHIIRHELIKRCRTNHIAIPTILIPARDDAWGTLKESIQIRNTAQTMGVHELMIVSSHYHGWRIMTAWKLIAPKIKVTFIPVTVSRKLIDYFEFVKMLKLYLFFFLYKTRLKKSFL